MPAQFAPLKVLSLAAVCLINIIQLLQALSFLKHAPKSGSWNSSVKDFIDWCKDASIRVLDNDFLAMYTISTIIVVSCLVLYIVFMDPIHRLNKKFSAIFTPIQYAFEYVIFNLGFIPMISKFTEVQICNTDHKIDSYHSVKCFKEEQMVLLQIGFCCIGISYLFATVIIPTLRFERKGVEKLWDNENYIEGIYYLILILAASLFGWLRKPEVGVLLCLAALVYGLVFECYDHAIIGASRCAVFASLAWSYAAAYTLKDDSSAGNTMIHLLAIPYCVGFCLKFIRQRLVKRKHPLTKVQA